MIIYLMGIDGAGKSTIADHLKKELELSKPCELVWARYQPRLVKYLISPFRKKSVDSSKNYNNMSAADYSKWTLQKQERLRKHPFLAKILFYLQYKEYCWQIRNTFKGKGNHHIIVDRYVLDFIVDQTINYGDISKSLLTDKLLRKLQVFDKIFFINVNSDVAFKRKTDIPSLKYLEERRKIYQDYIKDFPNAYTVDNSDTIEECIKRINNIIEL